MDKVPADNVADVRSVAARDAHVVLVEQVVHAVDLLASKWVAYGINMKHRPPPRPPPLTPVRTHAHTHTQYTHATPKRVEGNEVLSCLIIKGKVGVVFAAAQILKRAKFRRGREGGGKVVGGESRREK